MANWNRVWNEAIPAGSENANLADDYLKYAKTEVSERVQDLIYGFTSGEDTDAPGFKLLRMKQTSDPTTPADMVDLYCKDVGGNNELHWDDEAANGPRQLTNAGALNVVAGDYAADSIDEDDIRLANNAYLTARNQAGDGDINCIKINASNVPEILVGAVLSASTAPGSDPASAPKKYVDDQVVSAKPTAKGWCKFASNGTIVTGSYNVTSVGRDSAGVYTITWATDFADTNYVPVPVSLRASFIAVVTDIAVGTCKVRTYSISGGVFVANDGAAGITAFGTQ